MAGSFSRFDIFGMSHFLHKFLSKQIFEKIYHCDFILQYEKYIKGDFLFINSINSGSSGRIDFNFQICEESGTHPKNFAGCHLDGEIPSS